MYGSPSRSPYFPRQGSKWGWLKPNGRKNRKRGGRSGGLSLPAPSLGTAPPRQPAKESKDEGISVSLFSQTPQGSAGGASASDKSGQGKQPASAPSASFAQQQVALIAAIAACKDLEGMATVLKQQLAALQNAQTAQLVKQPVIKNPPAMVVVDPFSTGACVAHELMARGVATIRVLSRDFPERFVSFVPDGLNLNYAGLVQHRASATGEGKKAPEYGKVGTAKDVAVTVDQLRALPFRYLGVIPGCETGVELADLLSQAMSLRGNDPQLMRARRDKFLMVETIRKAGVPAAHQAEVRNVEQAVVFARKLNPNPYRVVVKPSESAGSDGVFLCRSEQEVVQRCKENFEATNMLGLPNETLVVQEYLTGDEYVVDTVSRDGVHKCAALWRYDKRHVNGKDFVYFGMRMVSGDGDLEMELIEYVKRVLDALQIKNGCGHAEVKLTDRGPVLVEIGARPHGGEGTFLPIAERCVGYSVVSLFADAYVDRRAFARTPDYPSLGGYYGAEVMLVSRQEGILKALPRMEEVKKLASFVAVQMDIKVGDPIHRTIDCMTIPGCIQLVHADPKQLEADFEAIREMELDGFFLLEEGSKDDRKERN